MAKAAFVACDRRQRCSQKMTFDARQRLSKVIKCGLSRAFTHAFDQRQRRFFVQWIRSVFQLLFSIRSTAAKQYFLAAVEYVFQFSVFCFACCCLFS